MARLIGYARSARGMPALMPDPHQVDPDAAELVNSGKFKKDQRQLLPAERRPTRCPVSIPAPSGSSARSRRPSKGLRDAAFADAEGDTLTLEFGEMECRIQADLWASLREWLIAQFGLERRIRPSAATPSMRCAKSLRPEPEDDAARPSGPARIC